MVLRGVFIRDKLLRIKKIQRDKELDLSFFFRKNRITPKIANLQSKQVNQKS